MSRDLPTVALGRTGLEVTRLGFGAMDVHNDPGPRALTNEGASTVLNQVLDAGINFIDTSIDYGASEEFIGKFISHRRSEFYLASKCGCSVLPEAIADGGHVYSRENLIAGVNQSLNRMKTDYLDIVQFHISPSRDTLEKHGAIDTLRDLQSEGKIRFIGSSSILPNIEEHINMGVFDQFQIPYSALQRQHEEVITRASAVGAGTVIRGGVASGEPGVSGTLRSDAWPKFDMVKLDELREEGESRTAFMLRFTLSHPNVHTAIVGTQNLDHLHENAQATIKGPLPEDVYREAKLRLDSTNRWT